MIVYRIERWWQLNIQDQWRDGPPNTDPAKNCDHIIAAALGQAPIGNNNVCPKFKYWSHLTLGEIRNQHVFIDLLSI